MTSFRKLFLCQGRFDFRTAALVLTAVVATVAVGCHSDMYDQPKIEPLEPNEFFADGRSARPLPTGAVPRTPTSTRPLPRASGTGFPLVVNQALLERGMQRYMIYCTPCHGRTGDGDGMIVLRGYRRPPTLHSDRMRGLPDQHFYDVMTEGFGVMPSYRKQVPSDDRWAITAYIRALQLSRHAPSSALTDEERKQLAAPEGGR
ncbi:MAG: cytochrome c [Pirellulales bacterium]